MGSMRRSTVTALSARGKGKCAGEPESRRDGLGLLGDIGRPTPKASDGGLAWCQTSAVKRLHKCGCGARQASAARDSAPVF